MNNIAISSDSVSDLGPELLQKHNIPVFPLTITLGPDSKLDHDGMAAEIFAYVEASGKTPKTAARGADEYKEFFKKHKPEGGSIIHFTISKSMSASFQNATAAANEVGDVYVIDTESLSSGSGLSVMYAVDLREQGLSAAKIAEKCQNRAKYSQASFVLDSLEYLHKGGRCSGAALFVSNMLNIKPMILVKNGSMTVGKKYMCKFDKAIDKYVDDILNTYNTPDLTRVFITHSTISDETVERVKEKILAKYPFKKIIVTVAGGTISSHCGKNTLGVLYFNDGE